VLAVAPAQASEGGGWAIALKEAKLPPPDTATVNFSGQEMGFVWRSHFVAASVAPLTKETREEAEAKGWTLFELPETVAAGVPDALIAMFGETAR
jgi:hypothetical protein